MISNDISKKILTIGCEYKCPKGGVAQVLHNYSKYVFPKFNVIVNSGEKGVFYNVFLLIWSIIKMVLILVFNPEIRIVHIHTSSYNSFRRSSYFIRIASWFKRKVVLHIHGGAFKKYYQTNPAWIKNILHKAHCVIALTNSWRDFFVNEIGLSNVKVLCNIAQPPNGLRDNVKRDVFHLLYLGQIYREKGIFDLVEMLCENYSHFSGRLVLDIGGGLFQTEELLNYINQNNLNNIIVYHGWVTGQKKNDLFKYANALILPSYAEGQPASIIEAMTYGLPILSTPVGGIPEIVYDNINGLLFKPGDKDGMKKSIDHLLDNDMVCGKMGKNSYEMSQAYLPDCISEKLEEIYESLL